MLSEVRVQRVDQGNVRSQEGLGPTGSRERGITQLATCDNMTLCHSATPRAATDVRAYNQGCVKESEDRPRRSVVPRFLGWFGACAALLLVFPADASAGRARRPTSRGAVRKHHKSPPKRAKKKSRPGARKAAGKAAARQREAERRAARARKKTAARLKKALRSCQSRRTRNTRKCRRIRSEHARNVAAEKARLQDIKERRHAAAMTRRCKRKAQRKSKPCRVFLAQQRRNKLRAQICGRRYGRARRRDTVASFARRHGVTAAAVRRLNGMSAGAGLRRGQRYVLYRSPWEGQKLTGGALLSAQPAILTLQRPLRGWGKPLTVEVIRGAAQAVARADPLATHLVVGDLSKQGGGCLPPHRSHRGGLDADIGYYMFGGDQRTWMVKVTPETIDADRTWRLLSAFRAAGRLRYAFIDYALQAELYRAALRAGETAESLEPFFQYPRPRDQAKVGIIRHLKGHADHMHVRFTCPPTGPCALDQPAHALLADAGIPMLGGVIDRRRRRTVRRRVRTTRIVPGAL